MKLWGDTNTVEAEWRSGDYRLGMNPRVSGNFDLNRLLRRASRQRVHLVALVDELVIAVRSQELTEGSSSFKVDRKVTRWLRAYIKPIAYSLGWMPWRVDPKRDAGSLENCIMNVTAMLQVRS
jgi:hypothetical protein